MTPRRRPYVRIEIGGLTMTVRDRPTWRGISKALAALVPLGVLLAGVAASWLVGRTSWR